MSYDIKWIESDDELNELEKKHAPVITTPDTMDTGDSYEVKVEVGILPHVMEGEHYIEWIELWLADRKIGRVDLGPSAEKAEAVFTVKPTKDIIAAKEYEMCNIRGVNVCAESLDSVLTHLRAIESCNVHGVWGSHKKIEIKEQK
ncbi:superoxide reductase [Methanohalophilus levihalophilus]|uniref:class II SORL domain-containing protein n=1 Tax=Methanohalophilus levihalophilus TaxID=1431282 RepID=UPI001AE849E8|nr:class II SORL domain-containing protein [Methanohalophilus levihalophilus]MBP2029785.1 superoxide reductase [Methanohalophilus levihalophilus]